MRGFLFFQLGCKRAVNRVNRALAFHVKTEKRPADGLPRIHFFQRAAQQAFRFLGFLRSGRRLLLVVGVGLVCKRLDFLKGHALIIHLSRFGHRHTPHTQQCGYPGRNRNLPHDLRPPWNAFYYQQYIIIPIWIQPFPRGFHLQTHRPAFSAR